MVIKNTLLSLPTYYLSLFPILMSVAWLGVLRSYSGIYDWEGWEMSLIVTSLVGGGFVNQFKMGD